jgi:hypothetical protein
VSRLSNFCLLILGDMLEHYTFVIFFAYVQAGTEPGTVFTTPHFLCNFLMGGRIYIITLQ